MGLARHTTLLISPYCVAAGASSSFSPLIQGRTYRARKNTEGLLLLVEPATKQHPMSLGPFNPLFPAHPASSQMRSRGRQPRTFDGVLIRGRCVWNGHREPARGNVEVHRAKHCHRKQEHISKAHSNPQRISICHTHKQEYNDGLQELSAVCCKQTRCRSRPQESRGCTAQASSSGSCQAWGWPQHRSLYHA
ncbi:hypothetical protein C8Q70DRAFT_159409 [Cubamyces menziesii]|nr:hypothetical protein C8Q70DRAFT_159409 [Cubamyces menziesii]